MKKVGLIVGIAAVVIIIAGVALWKYHEQPQFCAICHIMQPYLESWESSPFLAQAHAEDNITCLECHEPTIQQQVDELKAYVQGDFEVPLEERKFPMEFCFGCHEPNEHTSYEEVIQRTEGLELNPHGSHIGEMECRICHKAHRASEDYCAQCHGPVATGLGWTTEVSPTT
ncbi:MAG: cytochrome c3 family protein [Anaerolineae bacterium]